MYFTTNKNKLVIVIDIAFIDCYSNCFFIYILYGQILCRDDVQVQY